MSKNPPLLTEAVPEFAAELERLLHAEERPDLAGEVQTLRVKSRDRCGDDFCQSFYTAAFPRGSFRDDGEHETVPLNPDEGMVILDVVDGGIHFVEVLYRQDVETGLRRACIV